MAITKTLDLKLKPGAVAATGDLLRPVLAETRKFKGNLGVEVLIDQADETHWLLVERWESVEDDAAYKAYRATEEGAIVGFGDVLAGAPTSTYFSADESI